MSIHSDAAMLADDLAKDICKNETYVKTINGITSKVIEHGVKVRTGSSTLGKAAGFATQEAIKTNEIAVPRVVANVGTTVALTAGSIALAAAAVVAVPVLIIKGIFDSIFDD
jgi:hypothetical protein